MAQDFIIPGIPGTYQELNAVDNSNAFPNVVCFNTVGTGWTAPHIYDVANTSVSVLSSISNAHIVVNGQLSAVGSVPIKSILAAKKIGSVIYVVGVDPDDDRSQFIINTSTGANTFLHNANNPLSGLSDITNIDVDGNMFAFSFDDFSNENVRSGHVCFIDLSGSIHGVTQLSGAINYGVIISNAGYGYYMYTPTYIAVGPYGATPVLYQATRVGDTITTKSLSSSSDTISWSVIGNSSANTKKIYALRSYYNTDTSSAWWEVVEIDETTFTISRSFGIFDGDRYNISSVTMDGSNLLLQDNLASGDEYWVLHNTADHTEKLVLPYIRSKIPDVTPDGNTVTIAGNAIVFSAGLGGGDTTLGALGLDSGVIFIGGRTLPEHLRLHLLGYF